MSAFHEPTVGLDPGSRVDILKKILNLKFGGSLSVLWSTHLVDEAEKADKIIILNKGKVQAIGNKSQILLMAKEKSLQKAFLKLVSKG